MSLNYRTMRVVEAREINKLYRETYDDDIDIRHFLYPYQNDSCVYFNPVDEKEDTLWDLKVELGYIPDDYDGDGSEITIDISTVKDCYKVSLIRICDMLYNNGFTDTFLIDVSW